MTVAFFIANAMGRLFDRLKAGAAEYTVEPTGEGGFVLIRNDEHSEAFARLVRDLINYPNDEFAMLPTGDGRGGYERVVILPL
ncbi:MAG: hypothetical protein EBR82_09190 [Caulobacteraceae bacterium]|nr:hypothetical protein [Caulobacteraceae bacterium]